MGKGELPSHPHPPMGKGDIESTPYIPVRPSHPHICVKPPEPWFPWIVPTIFVVDVALFVYSMYVNDCPSHSDTCELPFLGKFAFEPFKENKLLGPSAETLLHMGALDYNSVVYKGEGWRLISCIWLHGGAVHLLLNMMSLIFIGIRLEQEFGFLRIGLLYVLSGFGGSLGSSVTLVEIKVSIGASGALFGLLGAMLSELITNWTIYANKCTALLSLLLVIALNLAVGFVPGVDNSAHIGGFLSGFFLGFILLVRPQFGYVSRKYIPPGYDMKRVKPKYQCCQYLLWVTAFVILVSGYATCLSMLYHGRHKKIVQLH